MSRWSLPSGVGFENEIIGIVVDFFTTLALHQSVTDSKYDKNNYKVVTMSSIDFVPKFIGYSF